MKKETLITPWMIAGAIGITIFLLFVVYAVFKVIFSDSIPIPQPTAVVAIIPAPSATPTLSPEAIPTETQSIQNIVISGIFKRIFVQISGTGPQGLRFRDQPEITGTTLFIASEAEVFEVKDGPISQDDFTWWYLSAPYDSTRSGWAVSDYLIPIPANSP